MKDKIAQVVLAKDASNPAMHSVPQLRRAQMDRLPNEITFKNPELLLAFFGAVAVLGLTSSRSRRWRLLAAAVFAFNLLPLLILAYRAMPYADIRQWEMLLKGGPEQRGIIATTEGHLRLEERVAGRPDYAFSGTMLLLYGVQGYSSLSLTPPAHANVLYSSQTNASSGQISVLRRDQVRYVWANGQERNANGQERNVSIVKETLNTIELRIDAGPAADLVRTDTY